ncbi:transporter [Nocardia otitidiscaviarum]|uniref:Transporter n=1 Tax=Nocardia otitidiscaviarum TaxID=1823 RepID=A0A516NMS5_9NOCA|nr:transporter [Nocardia otitidiscaviarum]MCP9624554.1 transporter [Nocardia otitidiscaviarum]QDP80202.1 transporter [Nocardia otitidiscaviarum]
MERTLWVVGCLAVFLLGLWLMYRAWTGRARRQAGAIGNLPTVPADCGAQLLEPTTGLYLGSTLAPSWIQRITVGDLGFRATAEMTRFERGILLERDGNAPIWIPAESITAVRAERGHAGKVMTEDGVLVIRWTLPTGTEVDTGFRGDDKTVYPAWTTAGAMNGDEA